MCIRDRIDGVHRAAGARGNRVAGCEADRPRGKSGLAELDTSGSPKIRRIGRGVHGVVNRQTLIAVSYTHLDVYKRQGLATSIARAYMAAFLLGAVVWRERRSGYLLFHISWRPSLARVRRLVTLGLPAASQIMFEGAVFGIVSALAARLDDVSLAAHSIAVQVIATTFMVPLGISSAAAVRVGQALGRKDPEGAVTAGWTALLFSGIFMSVAGVAMFAAPGAIAHIFIRDPAVVALCMVLLRIAALLELFDGFQVVATGALRGLGDTRSPMLAHFAGYWVVGLPVTYVFCFSLGWGVRGIWVGLTSAIVLIGVWLMIVWARRARPA